MRLPYSELVATYRVPQPFRLPHHSGSLLRGVLGRALRRSACSATPSCAAECEAPTTCSYARLFDPPVPDPLPHKLLRGATRAPQPLLPLIPAPGELDVGDTFSFGLRVLGRLTETDEQHLRTALALISEAELGRDRGRLELVSVEHRGDPNRYLAPPSADSSPRRATLTFETPAWIEQRKQLVRAPDFRTLFRNFNRRLTIMSALYGERDEHDDASFPELDERSEGVLARAELTPLSWERHSLERDKRHPMKGVVGSIELEGELGPFVELLRLAELTHVGKATSHGLGRVRVVFS